MADAAPVLAAPDRAGDAGPAPAGLVRPAARRYVVAPSFGVRVAGMPVSVLAQLRFTRTWALVDEVTATSAWLATEGAALSDALHGVVGEHLRSPLKPLLVALRRSVFTDRRPGRRTLTDEVLRALPDDLARRIRSWTAGRERREAGRARMADLVAAETTDKSAVLREAVAADAFRRGLDQASPALSNALDAWLAEPAGSLPGRQLRTRLAKYLARVAAKTSPYGTFAVSGFGRWTSNGPALRPTEDLSFRVAVELDHRLVTVLWTLLARRPGVRERVRLRVNPTAVDDGERVWFLGTDLAEPLSSVPGTASIRRLLELVRAEPHITPYHLYHRLAAGSGSRRGVDRLIDAGLLEPLMPYQEQAPAPLLALTAWLERELPPGAPERGALRDALARVQVALRDGSATEAAPGRTRRTRELRAALAECLTHASEDPPALPDKNVVMETALVPHTAAWCSLPAWRPACDDLDALRGFLGLFDLDLPVKLAAAGYFRRRYGTGATVPVLDLYRETHAGGEPDPDRDVLVGLLRAKLAARPRTLSGSPLPALRELGALRQQVWDVLGAGPEAGAEVVQVAPATLDHLAASWPRFVRPPESICCYVQPVPATPGPRLVLNTVTAGYGRGLTRLWRLLGLVDGDLPPVTDFRAGAGGVLLAECRGALHTGVNIRPATADVALDYPTAGEADLPSLALTELTVGYHPGTDRLVLRAPDGRPVRPLHLGMLAEYWLPPALRFLVRAFGEPAIAMPPGWAFRTSREAPAPGTVQRWPRLDVGRVTVARAGWRLWAGTFPTPGKGESDAAYLPRLAGWLARHGIPRQFFARVVSLARNAPDGGALGKARKPIYADVTNRFLLDDLVRVVAGDPEALMVIEEVLPDPADAPGYGAEGSRVTEYVVQLSAVPEGGGGWERPG